MTMPTISAHAPAHIHPANLKPETVSALSLADGSAGSTLATVRAGVGELYSAYVAIAEGRKKIAHPQRPTEPQDDLVPEFLTAIDRVAKRVGPLGETSIKAAKAALAQTEEDIATKITDTKTRPEIQREIREHISKLAKAHDRMMFLVKHGLVEITAVLSVPHYLSNLTVQEHHTTRELAEQKYAPELVARRQAINEVHSLAESAAREFSNYVASFNHLLSKTPKQRATTALKDLK